MVVQAGRLSICRLVACVIVAASLGPPAAAGAAERPQASAEVIVQFQPDVTPAQRRAAVRAAGGRVTRDLHVIGGLGVRASSRAATRLAHAPGVRAVTPNAGMRPSAAAAPSTTWNPGALATAFVQSTQADRAWADPTWPTTGAKVAVAVIDTGIAGDIPDFRSTEGGSSRVVASVVTNRDATTATDRYGHGTHVAGLIAGNGRALAASDPLFNRYLGTAPSARLVSIKASDDHGNASIIDVIAGLQFVVDHGADYGVRVVNLSLGSSLALPYRLDPLDAAVEAAWFRGIVVVTAAGNAGQAADAVSHAPANDPYAITVGAVDDHGTKAIEDDSLAPWSSRGVTREGLAKPELVAPGAHIVAPLAPQSDYASLCPDCIVDGRYFQISGTSMAAPIVAGIAADVISAHPTWTPNQVKGALTYGSGARAARGDPTANVRPVGDGGWEVVADRALNASRDELASNAGLVPSWFINPATGSLIAARASWGRPVWKSAADALRASWGAASWTCDCRVTASWARASWGRASWRSFFGETPGG
jgi:serine protease AprX